MRLTIPHQSKRAVRDRVGTLSGLSPSNSIASSVCYFHFVGDDERDLYITTLGVDTNKNLISRFPFLEKYFAVAQLIEFEAR